MQTFDSVRKILEQMKPVFVSKYHISSMGLFGSIVRNDFTNDSDIDVIVEFSKPVGIEFIDLANELEVILERKVDLVSKKGIKPNYLSDIEAEIVYV